jgi:signal peptidase
MKQKENDVTYMRNTMKLVWNTVTSILVGLMVILAALLWGFRLLGYEVLVVQSGSMEPNYHVGSLVYVKSVDASELETGDVITFELGGGVRGTHRIIEIVPDTENPSVIRLRTKGDANDYADNGLVGEENLIGQVFFCIPQMGYVITYLQQPKGMYTGIAVGAALLLLTFLPELLFEEEKKKV